MTFCCPVHGYYTPVPGATLALCPGCSSRAPIATGGASTDWKARAESAEASLTQLQAAHRADLERAEEAERQLRARDAGMVVAYNAGLSAEVAGLREGLERIRDWAEEVAADREGRSVIDPDELVARITQSLSTKDTET